MNYYLKKIIKEFKTVYLSFETGALCELSGDEYRRGLDGGIVGIKLSAERRCVNTFRRKRDRSLILFASSFDEDSESPFVVLLVVPFIYK